MHGYHRCLKQESAQSITWVGESSYKFVFENVACEGINQEIFFNMVGQPMVENFLSGYNGCIFSSGHVIRTFHW